MKRTYLGLVAAALLGLTSTANATPLGMGVIVPIGSWMLTNVQESGVGNFTSMEAFIVSGNSTFEATGWGTQNGGWTSQLINPTYAKTSGAALTTQWLTNKFTSGTGTMVVWDILAYNGTTLLERFQMWSDGAGWDQNNNTPYNPHGGWRSLSTSSGSYDRSVSAVPEPTTLGLLGVGLFGFGWKRRKSSKTT